MNCISELIREWTGVLLEPVVILVVAYLGYRWGKKSWKVQKQEEQVIQRQQSQYEAKVAATKAIWGLLAYISESDNDKNIFRRGETDENGKKVIYFRKAEAKVFIERITTVFYTEGHGVFMPSEIKPLLFELRSQVWAWYHIALKDAANAEIPITNQMKFERVVQIREQLNEILKGLVHIL